MMTLYSKSPPQVKRCYSLEETAEIYREIRTPYNVKITSTFSSSRTLAINAQAKGCLLRHAPSIEPCSWQKSEFQHGEKLRNAPAKPHFFPKIT